MNSFGLEFLEEMKPVELTDVNGATSVCTTQQAGDDAPVSDGCRND